MSLKLYPEENIQSIANAIRTKNGSSDTYTVGQMAAAIENIPTGGGGGSQKSVKFYDYDGTVVDSYTEDEFAELSAMPNNPSHEGLVAQGWNWTLADAKAYVQDYGMLNIGQMYITASGDTEIDIELHEGRLSPYVGIGVKGTVTIDWGDNSSLDTVSGTSLSSIVNTNHTYVTQGAYTVKIHAVSGDYAISGDNAASVLVWANENVDYKNHAYRNALQSIRIGNSVTSIGGSAFNSCRSLASVSIPDSVTSIGGSAFNNCYSLASVSIPDSVTSIGGYAFNNCYSLANVSISDSVTSISSYAFNACYSLASVSIPDSVTSIGGNAFNSCYSLASVSIPDSVTSISSSAFSGCHSLANVSIPDSVTSIGGSAFNNCYSLASVSIPDGVTSIGANAFNSCYSLASVSIPDSVTSIGAAAFNSCRSLASVSIPDSVTSISSSAFSGCYSLASVSISDGVKSIGTSAFNNCYSLASVSIPDSVTSIGESAFNSCRSIKELHMLSTTPPSFYSSALSNTPSDLVIFVPSGCLEAYQTASEWSSYASKMVEE